MYALRMLTLKFVRMTPALAPERVNEAVGILSPLQARDCDVLVVVYDLPEASITLTAVLSAMTKSKL